MKYLSLLLTALFTNLTVMAKEIKTEIIIQATPEEIWTILSDFENYPNWNPFITSINGRLEEGTKITVRIEPPNGKGMTFKPTVTKKVDNKEISWLGTFLFRGLFDGEHKFELIDNRNGTVTFIQSEKFKGIFVWLFNPEKAKNGFYEMNRKLKEQAEKD